MKVITVLILMAFAISPLFAQEPVSESALDPASAPMEEIEAQAEAVPATQAEPEMQWLWGEVTSVDTANKVLVVKYLDYETGQEKEITVISNDQTDLENFNSLDELKQADTLSIDYAVDAEGKNIAKSISIEKPEAQPAEEETAPAGVFSEQESQEPAPEAASVTPAQQ